MSETEAKADQEQAQEQTQEQAKEQTQDVEVKKVRGDELDQYVGWYAIFHRNDNVIGRIEEVDTEKGVIIWQVYGGSEDGYRMRSRYDKNATDLEVYTKDQIVIAASRL